MRLLFAAAILGCLAAPAAGGVWIAPDWSSTPEPRFAPVPLYWYTVDPCPVVYRTSLTAPAGCNRATALALTNGYLFVWVDGRRVFAYAPGKDTPPGPHELPIDLTGSLSAAGRHTLVVSAPRDGFALDGAFYAGTRRLGALGTDATWRAAKLPPSTVLELDDILKPAYTGALVRVTAGKAFAASEDSLAAAYWDGLRTRFGDSSSDAAWRAGLFASKGIYLHDDRERWWGGPERWRGWGHEGAALGAFATDAARLVAALSKRQVRSAADLASAMQDVRLAARAVGGANKAIDDAFEGAWLQDEAQMLRLAAKALPGAPAVPAEGTMTQLRAVRAKLEQLAGHPLSELNESRYDRLGWLPLPGLSDDDLGSWGVRVNAPTGPTSLNAPTQWLFSTDPRDAGIAERRWSIGYNIENQWPRVDVGKPWDQTEPGKGYRGIAWYRARVSLAGDWAGSDVEVTCAPAGSARLWANDQEITPARGSGRDRRWVIPAGRVVAGGENVLALRIQGDQAGAGILSPVRLSAVGLASQQAAAARTGVFSTPLSPCVVLRPAGETLELHHNAGAKLWKPGAQAPGPADYDAKRDGRLKQNWALLWLTPSAPGGVERPVLLAFASNPVSIRSSVGVTRVVLGRTPRPGSEGAYVVAVRPWVKSLPPTDPAAVTTAATLWARASLAIATDYACVTRIASPGQSTDGIRIDRMPRGPVLEQTNLYAYLERKDAWGTRPLKLAPLPPLCGLALDSHQRTLRVEGSLRTLQDGGLVAPYRAVEGADRVTYRYEVEPYRRRIGFTSWMFGGADVGVPGNYREMQLIALAGANSYRPQHNFAADPSPNYRGQTRVAVLLDACRRAGVNYTNNIDETLNRPREYVRGQYNRFIDEVIAHTENVARIVGGEPFEMVGYDLINEPFDHLHGPYNAAIKRLTAAVRRIDPVHPLYVEPCESWGAIQQILQVEPTGDPLTLYSFHDYNFRLNEPTDRWPTQEKDITSICRMWLPAFRFQAMHGVPMHCGEFGDFRGGTFQSPAETYLLADFHRLFDQFGMQHHYYSGRAIYTVEADGSLTPSNVVRAYRRYMARQDVNGLYGAPVPPSDRYARPDYAGIRMP